MSRIGSVLCFLCLLAAAATGMEANGRRTARQSVPPPDHSRRLTPTHSETQPPTIEVLQALVTKTCASCHSDRARSGNLSLAAFDVTRAGDSVDLTEKIIRKLRAGQMPPAGSTRPAEALLDSLAEFLEHRPMHARARLRRHAARFSD